MDSLACAASELNPGIVRTIPGFSSDAAQARILLHGATFLVESVVNNHRYSPTRR